MFWKFKRVVVKKKKGSVYGKDVLNNRIHLVVGWGWNLSSSRYMNLKDVQNFKVFRALTKECFKGTIGEDSTSSNKSYECIAINGKVN